MSDLSLDSIINNFKPIEGLTSPAPEVIVEDTITPETPETPEPVIGGSVPATTTATTETTETSTDAEEVSFTHQLRGEYLPDNEDEFTPDFDGVSNLVKTVAETHRAQGRSEVVDELFSAYPEMEGFLEFRMKGGKAEDYFKAMSESSAPEFDVSTVAGQKAIISQFLSSTLDEEDIEDALITMEETGKLEANAKKYAGKMEVANSGKLEALQTKQANDALKQEEDTKLYWDGIKKSVDSGKVGTATIASTDRKAFFEWMAVPKQNGKTQQSLDWATMTQDQKLAFNYFVFKKGDVSKLASRTAETTKVNQVINNIKNPGNRMTGGQNTTTKSPARINLEGGMSGIKFS